MELTAQCDHYNIQVRRRKTQKGLKKSSIEDGSPGIFGVPLETLLMKDRQVTGDNNLEVPIAFDKVPYLLFLYSLTFVEFFCNTICLNVDGITFAKTFSWRARYIENGRTKSKN